MLGLRHEFAVNLVVLTPLRVSTGDEAERSVPGEDQMRAVAIVARDWQGNLLIPASSLKGVLRASLAEADSNLLFGSISQHSEGEGHIARLWFNDAVAKETATVGSFTKTGIGLDPDLATAEANKLFNREFVGKGTLFTLHFTWFGEVSGTAGLDPQLGQVLAALNCGMHVGGSRSKGAGKLQADLGSLAVTRLSISDTGHARRAPLGKSEIAAMIAGINGFGPPDSGRVLLKLQLACDGPFMSRDGTEDVQINGTTREVGVALVEDRRCALWPESLAGALRGRATWLANVHASELVDPGAVVASLFGSKESRSKLWVEHISCTQTGGHLDLTSISIDRVTGGGREGKLYTLRPYMDPVFAAEISHPRSLNPDEVKLVEWLRADLVANGLELGHGGAKGFGWFDVIITEGQAA